MIRKTTLLTLSGTIFLLVLGRPYPPLTSRLRCGSR